MLSSKVSYAKISKYGIFNSKDFQMPGFFSKFKDFSRTL